MQTETITGPSQVRPEATRPTPAVSLPRWLTWTSSSPVGEATAPPFVLDTSVVTAVARGDPDIIGLIQEYAARGQLLVIPALAIAGASLDARSEEADDLLGGLELLENMTIAPRCGTEQAARLADIIARTGLDRWDAHVAAIADAAIYPVLTLDAAKWRQPSADLDEPLHVIEISDPDEQEPGG
jgi:predicted nucleic acid-binding protein